MTTSEEMKNKMEDQYDKLAKRFKELYLEGSERGREAMNAALNKAHEQLSAMEEFTEEQGKELKKFMARDLDQTLADAQKLGNEAMDRFNPARLGAGALASMAAAMELTSKALHSMSDKARQTLSYKTGEITSAGTLTCKACGAKVHLKKTGHVPPCPKCAGTEFSKGY